MIEKNKKIVLYTSYKGKKTLIKDENAPVAVNYRS